MRDNLHEGGLTLDVVGGCDPLMLLCNSCKRANTCSTWTSTVTS